MISSTLSASECSLAGPRQIVESLSENAPLPFDTAAFHASNISVNRVVERASYSGGAGCRSRQHKDPVRDLAQ